MSVKTSAIGLIIAHALTELYMLVWAIWPSAATAKVNLFIDKAALPEGMTILWWIKLVTDELLWCYVFFDYAYTALKTSRKKFAVVSIFFLYHITDAICFVWNYKQAHWLYIALLVLDVIALVIVFMPVKEKAKIIEMR